MKSPRPAPPRAVLIFPRDTTNPAPAPRGAGKTRALPVDLARILRDALNAIADAGYELVSVIDPAQSLDAHRMLVDGLADIVVATRPDHLAAVRIVSESAWYRADGAVPPIAVRRANASLRAAEAAPARTRPEVLPEPQPVTRRRPEVAPRADDQVRRGDAPPPTGAPGRRPQPARRPNVA